jgi:hypothetical protein
MSDALPLPARPPAETEVEIRLPSSAPGRPPPLRGTLKCARGIGPREVWMLRVPSPYARHPEGELVSLIVEATPHGWQAVGGNSMSAAIQMAEAVATGNEVREPVGVQLMTLTAGILALVEPKP